MKRVLFIAVLACIIFNAVQAKANTPGDLLPYISYKSAILDFFDDNTPNPDGTSWAAGLKFGNFRTEIEVTRAKNHFIYAPDQLTCTQNCNEKTKSVQLGLFNLRYDLNFSHRDQLPFRPYFFVGVGYGQVKQNTLIRENGYLSLDSQKHHNAVYQAGIGMEIHTYLTSIDVGYRYVSFVGNPDFNAQDKMATSDFYIGLRIGF